MRLGLVRTLCAALVLFAAATPSVTTAAPTPDVQEAVRRYRAIDAKVVKLGWACVFVAGDKREGNFAYTVGLSGKGQPELLLVSGDDEAAACTMLNLIAKSLLVRTSPLHDGDAPVAKMAQSVRLRSIVPNEFFDECTFAALWRDQHNIKKATGMQVVFADKGGHFPE